VSEADDLVFWPACVSLRPFREHVEAAAAGGFTSIAIAGETYFELRASLSAGEIRRIAEDAGTPIRHLDTLTGWAPIRAPEWAPPRMLARFDIPLERSLEICADLGITNIGAVAGYPPGRVPLDVLVEGFGNLCDRVAADGIWVDLEFMPILGLPDLAAAWAIVGGAGRRNSGILIDTWHFAKSGSSLQMLDDIPPHHLRSIQLSDGYRDQRGASLFEDMLQWRDFPGDGQLPVLEILRALWNRGGLRSIGSEVFSLRANAMSAIEAGVRSGETLRATLAAAQIPRSVRA
jgi:sugar phosphate isomerase/epimerase